MIGTAKEILEWITLDSRYAYLLGMNRQRMLYVRNKIRSNQMGEDTMEELLKKFKKNSEDVLKCPQRVPSDKPFVFKCSVVECLRPRYILPAVVVDHHGRLFHEDALVRACMGKPGYEDLNLAKVVNVLGHDGYMPSERVVRELLHRKGWNMIEPRHVLPSVWRVE